MTKKLLVFATQAEVAATARLLEAEPVNERAYAFDEGILLVTGMGLMSTASHLIPYLAECEEVWNFGIAGALNPHLPIGRFAAISHVAKNLSLPTSIDAHSRNLAQRCFPDIPLQDQGLCLLTSDYPIHHQAMRADCAKVADLVDMEGYAIAYCCKAMNKPCRIWKLVSDPCLPGGQAIIARWLDVLAQNIAQQVQGLLLAEIA